MGNLFCVLVTTALLTIFNSSAAAGSLDTYYLQRFGALYGNQHTALGIVSIQSPSPREHCQTPLYHGLSRDWQKLSPETQKALGKYLALPILSGSEQIFNSANFRIHYTTSGTDAAPSTAWIQTVAATFEEVYAREVGQMGYIKAPTAAGVYDIYLQNVGSTGGEFGETVATIPSSVANKSVTSFIILDNDFSPAEFGNQIINYTPLKALQITAAHEYHHAIQFGYNFFFDIWYGEATSTWIEDEVYDGVNQLYNYLAGYMNNTPLSLDTDTNTATGGGYGRWIFNRYLAEKNSQIIKDCWTRLGAMPAPADGADIPMLPVIDAVLNTQSGSLNGDFFAFSRKLYLRDWTSHTGEIELLHPVTPVATHLAYPVNSTSTPAPTVTLPHYSFAYYKFLPSASAPKDLVLKFTRASSISVTAFKRTTGGQVSEYPLNAATGTLTIPSFNFGDVAEVMLLICNNSAMDAQMANFNSDGSPLPLVTETTTPSAAGASKSGGCFIATAAYGSYLHPKVQVLRQFRDKYLLTTGAGRALVSGYYRLSPPLAAFIAKHALARGLTRMVLAPPVFVLEHYRIFGTGCALLAAIILCRKTRQRQRCFNKR